MNVQTNEILHWKSEHKNKNLYNSRDVGKTKKNWLRSIIMNVQTVIIFRMSLLFTALLLLDISCCFCLFAILSIISVLVAMSELV